MRSATQRFVGIDVAKAQLEIALRPTGERWAVVHDDAGIAALVERLQALPPTLLGLEATGGYQRAVVAALAAAGLPVAGVNPRHRPFACWTLDRLQAYLSEVKGIAMKRTRIDELLLAEGVRWRQEETWFGERVDPAFAEKRGLSRRSIRRHPQGVS